MRISLRTGWIRTQGYSSRLVRPGHSPTIKRKNPPLPARQEWGNDNIAVNYFMLIEIVRLVLSVKQVSSPKDMLMVCKPVETFNTTLSW